MPKSLNRRGILTIVLTISFALSPFSCCPTSRNFSQAEEPEIIFPQDEEKIVEIEGDESSHQYLWRKDDNIKITGAVVVKSGTMLMIEPGATIKFERIEGEIAPFIYVEKGGMILAEGTESEKIVFTSDQEDSFFSIILDGINKSHNYSASMRYVEISRAGGEYAIENQAPDPQQGFLSLGFNKAFAQEEQEIITDVRYALRHLGGMVRMENCRFHGNKLADLHVSETVIDTKDLQTSNGNLITVVNCNFENNQSGIAVIDQHTCNFSQDVSLNDCRKVVTLKNNYYGHEMGPYFVPVSYASYLENQDDHYMGSMFGGKIIGANSSFDGFRTKQLIVDPLIIIPGIMGSEKISGSGNLLSEDEFQMDPILHTYDDLLESLERNGYEKGKNLFEFPYQWRNSNKETAQKLGEKISDLQTELLVYRFDIVAHSMGGLVARQYIQNLENHWTIDQLITLGTPHVGAPEAYLKWEAGEGFFGPTGFVTKHHFRMEALHAGYLSLFKYIREKVPSVGELLPVYDYLEQNSQMREYSDNYPTNQFLDDLNDSGMEKLGQIRFYNIVGEFEQDSTIAKIKVTDETDGDKWEHGKPENFDDKETDRGLVSGQGDGTVPLESALAIDKGETIQIDSSHHDLPTNAQCLIFEKLTGEQVCFKQNNWDIPNILLINVFSPIDIQIEDPLGRLVGKDFGTGELLNDLKDQGAFYTGYEDVYGLPLANEFVTIPNPIDGDYIIRTQGTGEGGAYKVEVVSLNENEEAQEGVTEQVEVFEGLAELEKVEEMEVYIVQSEVATEPSDTISPTITISSPEDGRKYQNTGMLELSFEALDNLSSKEDVQMQTKFDEDITDDKEIDLSLIGLGQHDFTVDAKDQAGNEAQESVRFELETSLDSLILNTVHYQELGLVKNKAVGNYLLANLRQIKALVLYKENLLSNFKGHPIAAKQLDRILENLIVKRIEILARQIEKLSTKNISPLAVERLVEGLEFVKQTR